MSYSFTEKKRIRKSFATRPSVLEVPSLLEMQLRSYEEFLQANVKPEDRKDTGLQAAFNSIFPHAFYSARKWFHPSYILLYDSHPQSNSMVLRSHIGIFLCKLLKNFFCKFLTHANTSIRNAVTHIYILSSSSYYHS